MVIPTNEPRTHSAVSKKSIHPKELDEQYKKNTELFLSKWEDNEDNNDVRMGLLDDFISSPELRLNLFKRKQEFLICLNQCLESPVLYEKGIIISSDLIDIDVVNDNEILSLNPALSAIKCLESKKMDEESHFTMIRQVSALNVLCKLDRLDYDWDEKLSNALLKSGGLQTIISFLEQNHQQGYKAQAAQFLGMIVEHGSMNDLIIKYNVPNILQKLVSHPNKIVKQNAIEALNLLHGEETEQDDIDEQEESEEESDGFAPL